MVKFVLVMSLLINSIPVTVRLTVDDPAECASVAQKWIAHSKNEAAKFEVTSFSCAPKE